MRVVFMAIAIVICVFSGELVMAQSDNYKIKITVEGIEDTVAYLGYNFGLKKYLQDTSVVDELGTVYFDGDKDLKTGVYFLYSKGYYMEFIVDEQDFELKTKIGESYTNMEVINSPTNVDFRDFQNVMINHQKSMKEISISLDSTSTSNDSLVAINRTQELNSTNKIKRDSLGIAYKDSFVGQILALMALSPDFSFEGDSLTYSEKMDQYGAFRKGYFDQVDFNSEGLLRTPVFHPKVIEYLDRVTFQHPDSVIASVEMLLTKAKNNEEMYRYLLGTIFQKYQNPKIMGMDKVFVYLADEYYLSGKATWAEESMLEELTEEMKFHRKNQLGLKAPQIYFQDTTGVTNNLYNINHDYIVLYFYSPTCGHCKKKTPVLKEVYDKLDGKVEVVAVNTDTDKVKWIEFINELDLNWLNYADMEYHSNFRVEYNVRSTPMIYVLDKDKTLIAKKLDVEQLEDFINNRMKIDQEVNN
ncbi:MAG: thioredoxin-like domain-containing protein [Reichenbachiella sp.]